MSSADSETVADGEKWIAKKCGARRSKNINHLRRSQLKRYFISLIAILWVCEAMAAEPDISHLLTFKDFYWSYSAETDIAQIEKSFGASLKRRGDEVVAVTGIGRRVSAFTLNDGSELSPFVHSEFSFVEIRSLSSNENTTTFKFLKSAGCIGPQMIEDLLQERLQKPALFPLKHGFSAHDRTWLAYRDRSSGRLSKEIVFNFKNQECLDYLLIISLWS